MDETRAPAAEANRAYYQAIAGTNDYWRHMAAPRWRVAELRGLLARRQPRRVIDLGCGNGALLAEAAGRIPGVQLAGVDLSPEQIASNRAALPAIHWFVANLDVEASELPADALGAHDAVLATEIIEHLDHPEIFLRHALRLAAPGGRLYLTTQSGPVHETERRVGHQRHFTAAEMTALLQSTGWTVERVWNAGWPFHDASKRFANLRPDAVMRQFSSAGYGWKEKFVCALLRFAFRFNSGSRGWQLLAIARKAAA